MSSSMEILTCSSCGFDNPDNAKVCNKCGIRLHESGGLFGSDKYNYTRRWIC